MCEDRFWHTTGTLAALLPVAMGCCWVRAAVKCIDNQRDSKSLNRVDNEQDSLSNSPSLI